MKIDVPMVPTNAADAGTYASELEQEGFSGVYSYEAKSDPFLPLAVASLSTRKLELTTGIAVALGRSPLTLAQLANDLQLMSKGRFNLGLGSQVRAHIERRYSMPWSRPAARMREAVLAIRAIWKSWETGEKLNFNGEFYQHTLMIPAFNPGPNPHGNAKIFVAGVGPLMTEVAGEVGDGYLVHPFHTRRFLEQSSWPALQRGRARAGKTFDEFQVSCQVIIGVGSSKEELLRAQEAARGHIAFYASTPAYLPVLESVDRADIQPELTRLSKQGAWREMGKLVDDDLLHSVAVIGTAREVAENLLESRSQLVDRVSPVAYGANDQISVIRAVFRELRKLQ